MKVILDHLITVSDWASTRHWLTSVRSPNTIVEAGSVVVSTSSSVAGAAVETGAFWVNTVVVVAVAKAMLLRVKTASTVSTPADLAGPQSINKLCLVGVREWRASVEGDVVEAPIPNSGVNHAVRGEGHDGTNDSAGKNIIPVVVLLLIQGQIKYSRQGKGYLHQW